VQVLARLKIKDLHSDTLNANKGKARGDKATAESLKRYGAGRSIVVDSQNRIIAGNHVARHAPTAGIEDAIVVDTDGSKLVVVRRTDLSLDDPKARELAIADNRTSELGLEWDPDVLGQMAGELDLKPFFMDEELKEILPSTEAELFGDEDDTPEPPAEPITKPGDLYILGDHKLLCGDATNPSDVARLLDDVLPAMVFTDPPYGVSVKMDNKGTVCQETIMGDDTTDVAVASYNLCAAMNVPMIFWGANHYAADAKLPNASCWITWDKQEANNHIDQADCELAWTNIKAPARIFHHLWAGFRRDSEKGERRVHPTQKPVALIVEILDFFKAGKAILDLFGGSGSTLIACERTKRSALLMELDPKYCDVIVNRYETLTGKKAVLHGRTQTKADDYKTA
jgi:16S rRNA G966 N2-methylase RsmD